MTLNKAAAPPTRSAMPAATGNISSSSSRTVFKSIAMVDEQGSKSTWRVLNKDGRIMYEFSRTKEDKLGPIPGTTAALWYPAVLSPGVVASLGFRDRSSPPGFLLSF